MDLRKKILLIAAGVLIIIIGLILFFVFRSDEELIPTIDPIPTPTSTLPTENLGPILPPNAYNPLEPAEGREPITVTDNYFLKLARDFVERFESRSVYNNNMHIKDALALGTPRLGTWANTQIVNADDQYQSIRTNVVTASIEEKTDTTATVKVQVQQTRIENDQTSTVVREGRVEIVKIAEEWKVDGWFWNS